MDPQRRTLARKESSKSNSEGTEETSLATQTTQAPEEISSENPRLCIDQRGVLPLAIVLAPTRELASQIHLDARRLTYESDIRSVCVYGGNDIRTQLIELSLGCELIIATPGRLNDLVERGVVSLSQVGVLVLDEGDRMLDMGFEVSNSFEFDKFYIDFLHHPSDSLKSAALYWNMICPGSTIDRLFCSLLLSQTKYRLSLGSSCASMFGLLLAGWDLRSIISSNKF